ncbi:hypothetical protein ACVXZ4_06575 [Lacisediminihabitans sp. FW035]
MIERPAGATPAPLRRVDLIVGILLPVVSGALAIVGAILLATLGPAASFGWFAYVPLSTTSYVPAPWFSTPLHTLGAVLLVTGAGSVLFCLGWAAGRRSHSRAVRAHP